MSPRARLGTWSGKSNPGFLGGDKRAQPTPRGFVMPRGPRGTLTNAAAPCGVAGLSVAESFNKSDGPLGPNLGWTVIGLDDYFVVGNEAGTDDVNATTIAGCNTFFSGDVVVGITCRSTLDTFTAEFFGIGVSRTAFTSSANGYFFGWVTGAIVWGGGWTGSDPGWLLVRRNPGFTMLDFDQATAAPADGDTVELSIVGTSLVGNLNGSPLLTATDGTYPPSDGTPADNGDGAYFQLPASGLADDFYLQASTTCEPVPWQV